MERFNNRVHNQDPPDHPQFPTDSAGNALFDASQYAFFGNDVVDEVELGGLEEEEDDHNTAAIGFNDDEYLLDKKEVGFLQSISDVDELATNLSMMNSEFNESKGIGVSADKVASVENSYMTQWKQDDSNGWRAHRIFNGERTLDGKGWSSELFPYAHLQESQSLHRTSSYPQKQPLKLENLSGDPLLASGSSFTSYPPPGVRDQLLLNFHEHHLNIPYTPPTAALSPPNSSSNPHYQGPKANHASQFIENPLPLALHAHNYSSQWENEAGHFSANNASILSSILHQPPSQNEAAKQSFLHQQHTRHQSQPSHSHLTDMQVTSRNSHTSSVPYMLRRFDPMVALAEWADQRHYLGQQCRQNIHNSQQSYESVGQRKESWRPAYKSKYMTADELENILRMQLAATHSNDPYVDDYYHQASLAKKAAGARFKHHFCPALLTDIPPGTRANTEPHAFLQVEALGRVPFSSIRRPRPLLEVESPSSTSSSSSETKSNEKPLEQEPLLAARVAIEDGLCLLLDVDDIDRFLEFNQLQDGGAHLKRRRQTLLEGVAASLRLVDPLGKNSQTAGLTAEDDMVFVRLVSLPKGRKLLTCYIQRLLPGDELIRVVSMAILRHLSFLFGCLPTDFRAAETTANLARVVASSVSGMDLGALSACLATAVCSAEQPPFRPIGSLAGDGASIILKSILQRATDLLTDPRASGAYNAAIRALWQASFDEFFGLLTTYCMNKYDTVMQTVLMHGTPACALLGSDAASSINKEMPVDLLRASLPHTNEQQRKVLLDFARRSMPLTEQVD